MKSGTSMSSIINTKKIKKNRTMIKCDCNTCVNKERRGCRFGWEPINGKCNRFGTNHYNLTKDEARIAREQTLLNLEKIQKEKEIKNTSLKLLSEALDTVLTIQMIKECKKPKYFGNGRMSIQCINTNDMIIRVKGKDGKPKLYKVLNIEMWLFDAYNSLLKEGI